MGCPPPSWSGSEVIQRLSVARERIASAAAETEPQKRLSMTVQVLSGGAAKGIVSALRARFAAETGSDVAGTFSAVGAMADKFLSGDACDVLILTEVLTEDLTRRGLLVAGSAAPVGTVRTGLAVPAGFAVPDVGTTTAFAAALRAAKAVYVPDPYRSTAGVHFLNVLKKIGIDGEVMPKLRAFPNGETAMRNLAEDRDDDTIGCTQMTEIKLTRGLTLIGPLPKEHDLATVYTAAVSARAANPEPASRLVALLTGSDTRALRAECGFEL